MSKKIIMFCALAFVVAFAASAYAEVQNVKVSGDISIYGIYRDEYDLDKTSSSLAKENYDDRSFYASIARVKIEADLTDNVQATIRLLNERVWDVETSESTDADVDLAYITIKEMLYSPLTLALGRQPLRFGSGLIVGDPDTNAQIAENLGLGYSVAEDLSARKSFDALRATFDYAPWTIDLIVAKIDETEHTQASGAESGDEDLYGINVGYKFDAYNAATEAYLFVKDSKTIIANLAMGNVPFTTVNLTQGGDIYNLGLRGGLEPVKGLNLSSEVAYQFGDAQEASAVSLYSGSVNRDQKAWALDLDGAYTFDNEYVPTLGLGYSFRSGEETTNTGDFEAWNPMYEDQTNGVIADYIFSGVNGGVNSNANIIKVYGSLKPTKDITLAAKYYNYSLDEKLVASDGSSVTYPSTNLSSTRSYRMNAKKDLGCEIDLVATYDYTEDVQFGLTAGWFNPGDAFHGDNDDRATALLGSVKVVF